VDECEPLPADNITSVKIAYHDTDGFGAWTTNASKVGR
jgi:hypothetical protein